MMRSQGWRGLAVALVLAAAATAGAAPAPTPDKSPLSWVPASAPLVVHVHGLRTVADHVVAFLNAVDPKQAEEFGKLADGFFAEGVVGHKIRGVPKDGVIFFAFMEVPKDAMIDDVSSKAALIAAVTDYATFRDGLLDVDERKTLKTEAGGFESAKGREVAQNLFFVDKKDHVVVTLDKKLAELFAKGAPGLDAKISKTQGEKFLKSDVGIYLSMDVFGKEYADQIKAARTVVDDAIKNAEEGPDKTMKPLATLAKDAVGPLFQAVDDSQGVLYTLEIRPTGIAVHVESEARAGTNTAAALKDFKPAAFTDLDKLPSGQIYYVGLQTLPALYKLTGTMLFSSLAGADPTDAKAIDDAIADMLKAGPRVRQMAVTVPPGGIELWQFDDPEKAVAAQARLIDVTGAALVRSGVLKEKPEIKAGARKYKGFNLTAVHLSWDVKKLATQAAELGPKDSAAKLETSLKNLLGEDLRLWFGTDGKTFLQVTAKDWDAAEKQLDQYFKGDNVIGDDKAFAQARKELPAEATALMILDLTQYAAVLAENAGPLPGPAGAPPKPPPVDKTHPGYAGAAVTLRPERCALDVFVSAEAVKQIYKGYFFLR